MPYTNRMGLGDVSLSVAALLAQMEKFSYGMKQA